ELIEEIPEDEILDDELIEEIPEDEILDDELIEEIDEDETKLGEEEIDEMREKASRFDALLNESERYYNRTMVIPSGRYPVLDPITGKESLADIEEFLVGKYPITNALFEVFISRTGYKTTAEERGFGAVYEPRLTRKRNSHAISLSTSRGVRLVRRATWHTPCGERSSIHTAAHHPVVQVSFEDAAAFAAWSGKRLPTLAQWLASGGKNRFPYPWGEAWADHLCNTEEVGGGGTLSVDAFPAGASPFDVCDLLGNAMEWLLDRLPERYGEPVRLAAGGSFTSDRTLTRYTLHTFDMRFSSNILGFRCAGW
ncbi:MAG: formylglycine-generating enzyme family protein, partial [Desulfobacterales bacterium]|nr:formylglycine-generating enzyme family protein [Desulfobacterales bacterium]